MATQKGRNWSSGDIVTAANLSSIERGVSAVAEEYTPTTWANGNTVTAAALNNIEQGIVNAGGSSDFSTAEVTFINYANGLVQAAVCLDLGNVKVSVADSIISDSPETLTICMYGGKANMVLEYDNATTTGDIFNDGDFNYTITGDGTITISDSSGGQVA